MGLCDMARITRLLPLRSRVGLRLLHPHLPCAAAPVDYTSVLPRQGTDTASAVPQHFSCQPQDGREPRARPPALWSSYLNSPDLTALVEKPDPGRSSIWNITSVSSCQEQTLCTHVCKTYSRFSSSSSSSASNEAASAEASSSTAEHKQHETSSTSSSSTTSSTSSSSSKHSDSEAEIDPAKVVLEASLQFVLESGWTEATMLEGARASGLSPAILSLFPRREAHLVEYFMDQCRAKFEAEASARASELSALADLDKRLSLVVRMRLEQQALYTSTWAQALSIQALPPNMPRTMEQRFQLVASMWGAAGERTRTDLESRALCTMLGAVYTASELFMLTDFTPGFEDTWQFVQRRTAEGLQAFQGMSSAQEQLQKAAVSLFKQLGLSGPLPMHPPWGSFPFASSSSSTPQPPPPNPRHNTSPSTASTHPAAEEAKQQGSREGAQEQDSIPESHQESPPGLEHKKP